MNQSAPPWTTHSFPIPLMLSFSIFLTLGALGSLTAAAAKQDADKIMELLAQRLDDGGSLDDVKIDTYCYGDKGVRSAVIYGRGVGVWNGRFQFELERKTVVSILRRFVDSRFNEMKEVYGGRDDPGEGAVRIICRAGLSIGGTSRFSSQLDKGSQSKELKALADGILDLCQGPAAKGKTIASISEGLALLASGQLAPELLIIQLHRRKEPVREAGQPGGWLFRLEGAQATAQRFVAGKGFADPVRVTLAKDEIRKLAGDLEKLKVGSFPVNLFAEDYTDLTVAVMNREKQVQARRFAGMTRSTHGDHQVRFDQLYEKLSQLAERVLKEGQ